MQELNLPYHVIEAFEVGTKPQQQVAHLASHQVAGAKGQTPAHQSSDDQGVRG